jgi:hypothetical protein
LRAVALGLALAALAGVMVAPAGAEARRRAGTGTANPSALIAVEIAFSRLAHEKGQWTAFRKMADDSAVMFVPEPVLAKDWLRGRADPAASVQWEPYDVWMSCDGTVGVTRGAWQGAQGTSGYFTTVWRQQKDGEYLWVLDQGAALAQPMEKPMMLSASVADCPGRGAWPGSLAPHGDKARDDKDRRPVLKVAGMDGHGASDDGTLTWTYHVDADYARSLTVSLRKDGAMKQVLALDVSAKDAK